MTWAEVAAAAVADLRPIGLTEMDAGAALSERLDTKLLASVTDLPRILERLAAGVRVLDVEGVRLAEVTTAYFDTDDAVLFRSHAQRRRRRYKVRVRHYGDPSAGMLEVKARGHRGQTIKHRTPYGFGAAASLGDEGLSFTDEVISGLYGVGVPSGLTVRVITRFRRLSLVDGDAGERLTIDGDLAAWVDGSPLSFRSDRIVTEAKSLTPVPAISRALRGPGFKPLPMSKYCLSMAAADEGLTGSDWLPAMRWFGVEQAASAPSPATAQAAIP